MSRPAPNAIVHLELHTGNLARACDFYTRVCGWQPARADAGTRSYQVLEWGAELGGGVVECGTRRALWLPYVEVPDIVQATERACSMGAQVRLGPREGPTGWRSVLSVTDAGEIAFWQAKARAGLA